MTTYLSYRNQSIDLLCKSMDWFLYDMDLCHVLNLSHPVSTKRRTLFSYLKQTKECAGDKVGKHMDLVYFIK